MSASTQPSTSTLSTRKRTRSSSPSVTTSKKPYEQAGGNITTPATYMEIASYRDNRMRLFGLHGQTREFVLQKNNQHPKRNLKAMFEDVISALYNDHPSTKQFQIIIEADGLENKIVIPPRPMEQNTPEAIVREIARVDQSARQANLMGVVLHVTATSYSPQQGSGPKFNPLTHSTVDENGNPAARGIDNKSRLYVSNNDSYCLFYALELARLFHDQTIVSELKKKKEHIPRSLMTRQYFSKFCDDSLTNSQRLREYAMKLMRDSHIPMNLAAYGLEHMAMVQDFYDMEYPGMYRIVAFDTNPQLRPFFKGPNGRSFEVPVYLDNGHFDGLKRINTFFRVRNYCVDCEGTYNRDVQHKQSCVSRGTVCTGMGPQYPCQPEAGIF